MATLAEIELRLIAVEQKLSGAVAIPEYAIDVNDPAIAVNDICMGVKAGINLGAFFIGKVLAAPPTSDTDLTIYYP